jgi:hypothetical protein
VAHRPGIQRRSIRHPRLRRRDTIYDYDLIISIDDLAAWHNYNHRATYPGTLHHHHELDGPGINACAADCDDDTEPAIYNPDNIAADPIYYGPRHPKRSS